MKPPEDVKPSELYLKLLEAEPSEEVDFPRKDQYGKPVGKLRIRVLSQDEHDRARLDGERALLRRGVKPEELTWPATREVLGDTIAREVLAMACLTAEKQLDDEHGNPIYARVFHSAKDLVRLRADEIAVLFAYFELVQAKFGPYESNLEKEDIDAWIMRLAEGAETFPLARLPLPQLADLALCLAQRIFSLYKTLASQRSTLPPTLVSVLDDFCAGTGSFGERADDSTDTYGASADSAPVTEAAAVALAQNMGGK